MSDATLSAGRTPVRTALEARLAARHRAEQRFRLAGVAAVSTAGLALFALLASMIFQGASALIAHQVTLEVTIPESVDPGRTGDPAVIRGASFNGFIQNALRAEFPTLEGRSALSEMFGIVSSLNAGTLLNRVIDDPFLVGQTVSFDMPISDDLDLYFKGKATPRERRTARSAAELRMLDGEVEIVAAGPEFGVVLASLKRRLLADAEDAEAEVARLERLQEIEANATRADARVEQIESTRARAAALRARATDVDAPETLDAATPTLLVYLGGGVVRARELSATQVRGEWLLPGPDAASAPADQWSLLQLATPQEDRRVSDRQIVLAEELRARGQVRVVFNHWLFTRGDSREPELAGMKGALVGSILTMFVTMLLAAPIGVAAAVYLEEFAPKNRWTDIVEVNINNLAAVPSIVFGLLGLAVFINFFGLPRSAPLVGGMVLALITLPTIIIATRASLKAVPPSIRVGALGLGASPVQAVFHHVLPLAAPGILTGSIIGLAHALGETAPLLMIGMVAFVADPPMSLAAPATVMPVQVYLWADSAERAFEARTAALILSLLVFMVLLNLVAVLLRRRFERRW
jgi:phosphate transport system permease protein